MSKSPLSEKSPQLDVECPKGWGQFWEPKVRNGEAWNWRISEDLSLRGFKCHTRAPIAMGSHWKLFSKGSVPAELCVRKMPPVGAWSVNWGLRGCRTCFCSPWGKGIWSQALDHSLRTMVSAGFCRGSGGIAGGGGSLTCYKICFPLKGINVFLDQRPRGQVPCQCSLVWSLGLRLRSSPCLVCSRTESHLRNVILLFKCILRGQSTNTYLGQTRFLFVHFLAYFLLYSI